jgi:hypothetical protein
MAAILNDPSVNASNQPPHDDAQVPSAPGVDADHASWAIYNTGMRGAAHKFMTQKPYQ